MRSEVKKPLPAFGATIRLGREQAMEKGFPTPRALLCGNTVYLRRMAARTTSPLRRMATAALVAGSEKAISTLITTVRIQTRYGKKILKQAAMGPSPTGFAAFRADTPV